jgi:hypothetical protein
VVPDAGDGCSDLHPVKRTVAAIVTRTGATGHVRDSFSATDDLIGQRIGHFEKTLILQAFTAGKRYPDGTQVLVSQWIGYLIFGRRGGRLQ